jgi:toxin ParE1/3/4
MAPRAIKTGEALRDLLEIAGYIAEATGPASSDRFTDSAAATLERLAKMPGLGSLWRDDHPELADLRVSSVDGFRNHLVFYRPIDGGIEVVRVLHGMRDLGRLLEPGGEMEG